LFPDTTESITMPLLITNLAERPDLSPVFDRFIDSWPEFMYHDAISAALFDQLVAAHPETNLIAIDPADPDRPIARACAFPFTTQAGPELILPRNGYDQVLLSGTADLLANRRDHRVAAALEVTVRPDHRGHGLSATMLGALRRTLVDLGYDSLVVPVRPNQKHLYPSESLERYLSRLRPDGLPADPWLRTHLRAGATIAGLAPASMTVIAPLYDWRDWTGLPFDADGPVIVPLALAPVRCDLEAGIATYVEPNVWVHHRIAA
jgi:GNAT superfamily N-acetyltransferase